LNTPITPARGRQQNSIPTATKVGKKKKKKGVFVIILLSLEQRKRKTYGVPKRDYAKAKSCANVDNPARLFADKRERKMQRDKVRERVSEKKKGGEKKGPMFSICFCRRGGKRWPAHEGRGGKKSAPRGSSLPHGAKRQNSGKSWVRKGRKPRAVAAEALAIKRRRHFRGEKERKGKGASACRWHRHQFAPRGGGGTKGETVKVNKKGGAKERTSHTHEVIEILSLTPSDRDKKDKKERKRERIGGGGGKREEGVARALVFLIHLTSIFWGGTGKAEPVDKKRGSAFLIDSSYTPSLPSGSGKGEKRARGRAESGEREKEKESSSTKGKEGDRRGNSSQRKGREEEGP